MGIPERLESGVQVPLNRNLESSTVDPESTAWNPEYTFLACVFCFPNSDHVMFTRDFSLDMEAYARECTCMTCIGRNLKETILGGGGGNITWSAIRKHKLRH